jgi:hypothetical protein
MHIYSPYIPRVLPTDKSCTCYNVGMEKNLLIEVMPLAKYLGILGTFPVLHCWR